MYIDVVTKEIDDARALIKNTQPTIRSFVTNKDFPLDERYRVWSEYVEKTTDTWIAKGIIGEYLGDKCADGDIDKYKLVDYDDILNYFSYDVEQLEENEEHSYFGSLEELKELLIEENFGSCEIDW